MDGLLESMQMIQLSHGGMSFEEHALMLAAALDGVEQRSQRLAHMAQASDQHCHGYRRQLDEAAAEVMAVSHELAAAREREQHLQHEVARLGALLEASRLQARFREEQMHTALAEERARTQAMRVARDAAMESRDEAITDLAIAYADIEAMQATLADSALYVRQLRQKVVAMEQDMHLQARSAAQQTRDQSDRSVFSLTAIKAAIQQAVTEAGKCEAEERKRRIRQLQLRWHPDKNAVLKEFATEVTKLINEAVAQLEGVNS